MQQNYKRNKDGPLLSANNEAMDKSFNIPSKDYTRIINRKLLWKILTLCKSTNL